MDENLITALEASWELDPVLMEDKLWKKIKDNSLTKEKENDKIYSSNPSISVCFGLFVSCS